MGDNEANHSQAERYKVIKNLATYMQLVKFVVSLTDQFQIELTYKIKIQELKSCVKVNKNGSFLES